MTTTHSDGGSIPPKPAAAAESVRRGVRGPRAFGSVNWVGWRSLYSKEVRRFLNVATQTVAAPVVTTLLFLAIFTLALGRAVETVHGVPFPIFLAPGLIVMAMVQNAFANTSSSLVISKVQGNIVDVLMPPINSVEFVSAYALAGTTRGVIVGLSTGLCMWLFVPFEITNPGLILYHGISASLMLSLIGIIGGIWADKFDHMAAITNFIITPFAFLSGTFYSIERLPEPFYTIAFFNPFFYMIDGFRSGFIGVSDAPAWMGMTIMFGINLALAIVAWRMVDTGYKLKN
ncbi:MAG: ABC transporter permease [Alphaproteobacteria bacterium]|jgi:ABC-2 type transport system permease protein|uniref:ABC transporter permease n=1 Tax=Pacificispira sp. TaxID=2888761 RepID=UPI001B112034|nr:ABC transporter permease [Alphaproteobacteria bacterium]MEC9266800.1 ABC transporter permease [Pseudomonadota bacterium]